MNENVTNEQPQTPFKDEVKDAAVKVLNASVNGLVIGTTGQIGFVTYNRYVKAPAIRKVNEIKARRADDEALASE